MEIAIYDKLNDPVTAIKQLGMMFAKSGMFGCERPEQGEVLAMICMVERKSPVAITTNYDIVEGKLRKKALAALADFRSAGGKHKWLKSGDEVAAKDEDRYAELELTDKEGGKVIYRYSMADAKAEGLVRDKSRWTKRPGNMLRARCISNGLGMLCPEIFAGEDGDDYEAPEAKPLLEKKPEAASRKPEEKPIDVQATVVTEPTTVPEVKVESPVATAEAMTFTEADIELDAATERLTVKSMAALEWAVGGEARLPFLITWLKSVGWIQDSLSELAVGRAKNVFNKRDEVVANLIKKGGEVTHRPSSLPMLAQCPAFESSGSDFAELGTDRHAALKAHYNGDDSLLDLLDDESQEGVRWAADYIKANSTDGYPTEWEIKRSWMRPDLTPAEGTPDVTNGAQMFDFKWRYRDYTAQMADYALWLIEQGFERVTVHLLFGCEKRAVKVHFDFAACEAVILPILASLENPKPKPCDYCGWCAKQAVCSAYVAQVREIRRQDVEDIFAQPKVQAWIDAGCHTSELVADAELVAMLLRWSRQFSKIHEGIEHFAKEAAVKHGLKIPGYELKERQGREFVTDTQRAFELSGLPAEKFLTACAVRLNTSKTNAEQIGLDKLFADALGLKNAPAKREAKKKLAEVIQRAKPTLALVSTKGEVEEEKE